MYVARPLACAAALLLMGSLAYAAETDNKPDIKGLWLTTDFPSLTLHAGEKNSLGLTLYNYGLAPQRTDLSINQKPDQWTASIEGQGKPVSAAFVDYNGRASFTLKLDIPADAKPGDYKLVLDAVGPDAKSELPIAVHLQPPLAAKLTAEPKLPVLKGSPKSSFDFSVSVKNDSASDVLANLTAQAPPGFDVTFKEGYGSQELTSIPIKAGESKDLTVSVKPAQDAAAGQYPVVVRIAGGQAQAETKLSLDISGTPSLSLTGEGERLSGTAYAGQEKGFPLVLRNTGTAPARNLTLSSSAPTDWKVTFQPDRIDELAPNGEAKVTALVTPAPKALDGDYMVSLTASGDGTSESANYRVTVLTSTLWGAAGVGVIGVALLVLVGAVGRYGRR
jgi:uncharacterized membrane protein